MTTLLNHIAVDPSPLGVGPRPAGLNGSRYGAHLVGAAALLHGAGLSE